jgi:Mn2+/Fe2+ NRAMP family transporter
MSLAWVVVVGVIGICLFAEMAGRVATVSGRAVFDLVRERLGARVALVNLMASFSGGSSSASWRTPSAWPG